MSIISTSPIQLSPIRVMVSSIVKQPGGGEPEEPEEPAGPVFFDETGTYGNIALIGTNGIVAGDITESTRKGSNFGSNAYDGWNQFTKINSDAGAKLGTGTWIAADGQGANQWISIDLKQLAYISGFRMHHPATTSAPSSVKIQGSEDGITFTDHESFTIPVVSDTGVLSFSTNLTTRYVRLFVVAGGFAQFGVQIQSIEFFQSIAPTFMQETGINKNIALIGTNGMSVGSVTVSEAASENFEAEALHDGYQAGTKINDDAGVKQGTGSWVVTSTSNEWAQLDFTDYVDFSGFGIYRQDTIAFYDGRLPKNITVKVSDDGGSTFTVVDTVLTTDIGYERFDFPASMVGNVVRFEFADQHGATSHMAAGEIEIYQVQP